MVLHFINPCANIVADKENISYHYQSENNRIAKG